MTNKGEILLISKIREGEKHAFEIAFLKYFDALANYGYKFVRSRELAREITQEVFTKLWENRERLDETGNLQSLLYTMCKNLALDYIKKEKITEKYLAEFSIEKRERSYSYSELLNEEEEYPGLMEALSDILQSLPAKARLIYELNRDEGLKYVEIAEYLGISVKTVETQMCRNLQKIREGLAKYAPAISLVTIGSLLYSIVFFWG